MTGPLFKAAIESALNGFVIVNRAGTIIYANQALATLLSTTVADLVGHPVTVLMPADSIPNHQAGWNHYLSTGESQIIGKIVNVHAQSADGSLIPVALHVTPIAQNGFNYFLGILIDRRRPVELEDMLFRIATKLDALKPLLHKK